jgi:hypothetical protein
MKAWRAGTFEEHEFTHASQLATYTAIHKWLNYHEGPASEYECEECTQLADDRCYVGDCPDEQRTPNRGNFCPHPEHYITLCRKHHRQLDLESYRRPPATHCKRGHEFTPENTITSKGGRRRCRICKMKRDRISRQRRRQQRFDSTS